MQLNAPMLVIYVLTPFLAFAQAVASPIPTEFSWVTQAERMGLLGCLLLAVAVLWKQSLRKDGELKKKEEQFYEKLQEKDRQLVDLMRHVTEIMTSQVETNRELRKTIDESVKVKLELMQAFDRLRNNLEDRPCMVPEPNSPSSRRR